MHKIISFLIERIDDLIRLLNIICAFFILITVLYWVETIIKAQWTFLNFIKPTLNTFLDFIYNLTPLQLHSYVESSNGKFIIAITLLVMLVIILKYLSERIDLIHVLYDKIHSSQKLLYEKSFNKRLNKKIEKEQIKISKYMIWIGTSLQKKFTNSIKNIDTDEQNKLMNDFIYKKTGVKYQLYENGFLYCFDDFNQIDSVLDILFKILKSNSPLDYKICVLLDLDTEILKKLIELNHLNKIIACADTVLRYRYNNFHRYGTQCLGVYQKDNGTIEIHEFYEIL